jgi:hypothetical protein
MRSKPTELEADVYHRALTIFAIPVKFLLKKRNGYAPFKVAAA